MNIRDYLVQRSFADEVKYSFEFRSFNGDSGRLCRALGDVMSIVEITGEEGYVGKSIMNMGKLRKDVANVDDYDGNVLFSAFGGSMADVARVDVDTFAKWVDGLPGEAKS